MMKRISTLALFACLFFVYGSAQNNVGIGTSTPHPGALLHVDVDPLSAKGLLITGTVNASPVPDLGEGIRLMFYPCKAAFRAGFANDTSWNNNHIGIASMALGNETVASGHSSTAMGVATVASGSSSTAMGIQTKAIGSGSTAMGAGTVAIGPTSTALGNQSQAVGWGSTAIGVSTQANGEQATALGSDTYANGDYSVAMGINNTAVGDYSTVTGSNNVASGNYSMAMGRQNSSGGQYAITTGRSNTANGIASIAGGTLSQATGDYSVAIGEQVIASGLHSFALGRKVSTNAQTGAFFFGDSDPYNKGIRNIGFHNQIAMRFNGGYYFISSNAGANDIGVQVTAGGNSWSALSDVNRKENFLAVDGEAVLQKISKLHLPTWNYKGQDAKTFRHYGPMAQEFFAAFGKDDLGTIGCDTLINQHDFLGVNLIAVQALEKRTSELQKENSSLKEHNQKLEARLERLEKLVLVPKQ